MSDITENQRLKAAIEALKKLNIIQFSKDVAEKLGTDKYRLTYLTKENGGNLTTSEFSDLKNYYPQINWDYVVTGQGSLLEPEEPINLVADRQVIYGKKPELDQLLSEIITGTSTLPLQEQLNIARNELVRLQQKIVALVRL